MGSVGQFEDHATLAVVNRNLPVPAFKVSRSRGRTIVKTAAREGLRFCFRSGRDYLLIFKTDAEARVKE